MEDEDSVPGTYIAPNIVASNCRTPVLPGTYIEIVDVVPGNDSSYLMFEIPLLYSSPNCLQKSEVF